MARREAKIASWGFPAALGIRREGVGFRVQLRLTDREVTDIESVVTELAARHDSVESAEFLRESRVFAQELPRRVRSELNRFRLIEPSGTLVITGWSVDEAAIGPTPTDPRHKSAAGRAPARLDDFNRYRCQQMITSHRLSAWEADRSQHGATGTHGPLFWPSWFSLRRSSRPPLD